MKEKKMCQNLAKHTQLPFGSRSSLQIHLCTKGQQNMPTQNMPFWHKDYFELKATKKKSSLLSFDVPKSRT